jgi:hypothetical protein
MSASPQVLNRRWAEILFSVITGAIGVAVIKGALEMDVGWTSSGPDAGYFPFRVGLIILAASIVNLVQRGFLTPAEGDYISRKDAGAMALFFVPLVGLAIGSLWLGLYLAIALYLILAIGWIGKVAWHKTLGIALGASIALYVTFEFIFRLPLPKGPLGPLFGVL